MESFSHVLLAKVSLDRVDEFLRDAELLDIFASTEIGTSLDEEEESDDRIGFRNATFVWSNMEGDGSLTSASRNFKLRIARELLFKRGGINLIVGPTYVFVYLQSRRVDLNFS